MGKVIPHLQLFLILILLSLGLFGLDQVHLLTLPKSALYFMTNPISFGLYQTKQTIGSQFNFIFAARRAGQENKALQDQLAQVISENAQLRTKLAETEALTLQQQSLDPRTYNLTAARPIGLDRNLKIDKGSIDGVKINQPVVFKENFLGQIVSVAEKGASVRLLTDPDSKIAVFSMGKSGSAKGLLQGQFGSEALMDKILHEEQISVGDLVYSEGTEGFLPRGLILGRVTKVMAQEIQVFKQAKVVPIFDVRDLELVFVIEE